MAANRTRRIASWKRRTAIHTPRIAVRRLRVASHRGRIAARRLWNEHRREHEHAADRRGPRGSHVSAAILIDMSLLDDEDELPSLPEEAEATLAAQLGAEGLRAIDEALSQHARRGWLKAARVVADALKAGGFPISGDAYIDLHVRRLITLVHSGVMEAQGNLRRPRWSERLPTECQAIQLSARRRPR